MSTLRVNTINDISSSGAVLLNGSATNMLGYNQTWQNLLASRADSVWYQNTSGRTIFVSIFTSTNQGYLYLNTTASLTGAIQFSLSTGSSGTWANNSAAVPNGYYYQTVSIGIQLWNELR